MKFRIGDKVKFLHDKGHGEVSSIIDKKTVMVHTEDGFDMPFLEKDLVIYGSGENKMMSGKDEAIEDSFEKREEEIIPGEPEEAVEDEEIVFSAGMNQKGTEIFSHLVNSSSYHLYYTVSRNISGEQHLMARGLLEADTKVRLARLSPSRMDDKWELTVHLLFWKNSFYKSRKPAEKSFVIEFSGIYSGISLVENDYFEQKTCIYNIYSFKEKAEQNFGNKKIETNLASALAEKEQTEKKIIAKKTQKHPETEEVDLHIQSITDSYENLSNGEILNIQLSRFRTTLETAMIHKTRRIVYIHGIGNGKLKHELRRTLDRKYPQLKYQDASFKEYGYGATLVIIPV